MPTLELLPHHRALLERLLAEYVPDAEVWAYGSRVTGGGHDTSDLDLVLRNPADLAAPVAGRHGLIEALRDSTLPLLVEVWEWAQLPASFREEVGRGYVVVRRPGG